jgi:hypothetical protein
MDALEGVPFMILEERHGEFKENHAPQRMTLSNALFAFCEEVERRSIEHLGVRQHTPLWRWVPFVYADRIM